MRDFTSPNSKRAEPAPPLQLIEDARFLRKGADSTPRVVILALSGSAATAGDVAAGVGRGVAGVAR